ncbi:hypothetical protein evm_013275 [Chilo suppressalis]|nr:hypothetical protein evm_013275 [Chilo suppressalis]
MLACAVFYCQKKSKTSSMQKDGVTFHFFPKEYSIRKKWVDFFRRINISLSFSFCIENGKDALLSNLSLDLDKRARIDTSM